MEPAAKPFGKYTLATAKLIKNGDHKIAEFIPRIEEIAASCRRLRPESSGSATEINEKVPIFNTPPMRWEACF